ncbi:hypothetical protein CF326_g8181 [Tilletia indica]|nr:hypothetical protein CF326_g8181 [Tilletia indica]
MDASIPMFMSQFPLPSSNSVLSNSAYSPGGRRHTFDEVNIQQDHEPHWLSARPESDRSLTSNSEDKRSIKPSKQASTDYLRPTLPLVRLPLVPIF